jgi:hypothetical protein
VKVAVKKIFGDRGQKDCQPFPCRVPKGATKWHILEPPFCAAPAHFQKTVQKALMRHLLELLASVHFFLVRLMCSAHFCDASRQTCLPSN